MSPPEPLWKAPDVAAYMGVTVRHVWELARLGKLPMRRLPDGRGMRFEPREVRLALASRTGK